MAIIKSPYYSHWRANHFGQEGQLGCYGPAARSGQKRSGHSVLQQIVRQRFQTVHGLWIQTSPAQKNDWNLFGSVYSVIDKYGNAVFLNGYHWFNKLNLRLLQAGSITISDPPPNDLAGFNPSFGFYQLFPGSNIISIPSLAPTGTQKILYYRKLNISKTITKINFPLKFYDSTGSAEPGPKIVAFVSELRLNISRSFFSAHGIDQYGLFGDVTVAPIDPVSA